MKKIIIAGTIAALLMLGIAAIVFRTRPLEDRSESLDVCDRHYVLITNGENTEFWDRVYQSAKAEGLAHNVYVEMFGSGLSMAYSRDELLKIARQASVDGIIVEADEDATTGKLIDEIVNEGIPVVTAMRDCYSSLRQSFVGVNHYDTGVLYGQKIASLLDGKQEARVLVIAEGKAGDVHENLVLLGIRETLAKEMPNCHVQVDSDSISRTSSFAEEEYFNTLFMGEDLPDILICQDAVGTICAYQSAVDHNQVGSVDIIGFYDSDTILTEVQKGVLTATLSIDAEQAGRACVDALEDYYAYGYTNEYNALSMALIDEDRAEELLTEEVTEE